MFALATVRYFLCIIKFGLLKNNMQSIIVLKKLFVYNNILYKYDGKYVEKVLRDNWSSSMIMHALKTLTLLTQWFAMY